MKLIGLIGPAGAGKSEVARVLKGDGDIIKFADPIKDMMRALFSYAVSEDGEVAEGYIESMVEGCLKEVPIPMFGGATPRRMMQTLGTEWRDLIDPLMWTRIYTMRVKENLALGRMTVTDDVRFFHEVITISKLGGALVRVERPGVDYQAGHKSEGALADTVVGAKIVNDGDLETLAQQARLVKEELDAKGPKR